MTADRMGDLAELEERARRHLAQARAEYRAVRAMRAAELARRPALTLIEGDDEQARLRARIAELEDTPPAPRLRLVTGGE